MRNMSRVAVQAAKAWSAVHSLLDSEILVTSDIQGVVNEVRKPRAGVLRVGRTGAKTPIQPLARISWN